MPSLSARALGLLTLMSIACWQGNAGADGSLDVLARRLRDDSFKVRVQAALALGASGSQQAVGPLCGALDDKVASVRTAAAAGLGRLRLKAGATCLRNRLPHESNSTVSQQLSRSISLIEGASNASDPSRASRPPSGTSTIYVAVAATRDASRSRRDVDRWVQSTIRGKLLAMQSVAIAPHGEDAPSFAKKASKHRVRGLLLRPTLETVSYAGTRLTVVLRLTLFTYPDMALQAEFAPKLTMTMPTAGRRDPEAEEQLIRMAAERAVEKFVDTSI